MAGTALIELPEARDREGRYKSRRRALALLILFLPFGTIALLTLAAVDLFQEAWTGITEVDELLPAIIWGVLGYIKPVTPAAFQSAIFCARALAAIANAEQSFNGAVGDSDASLAPGGPSVSPWQLERVNAIALGFYSPPSGSTAGDDADRAAYAGLPTQGVHTFIWAYRAAWFFQTNVANLAQGDLTSALRIWNGGPKGLSNSATATYAQKSAALISRWA